MGRSRRLWRYGFLVHIPEREDKGASVPDWLCHSRRRHKTESCPCQTEVREGPLHIHISNATGLAVLLFV